MYKAEQLRRTEILDVAKKLFARYGLDKTTTKDISSALNLQKGALYYYFKNKEEIYSEVIRLEIEQLQNELEKAMQHTIGVVNKMVTYVRIRMMFLKLKSNEFTTIRDEYLKNYGFIEGIREEFSKWESNLVNSILKEGNNSGELHLKETATIAETITLAIKGLEYVWITKLSENQIKTNVERFVTILFKGLLHST